MNHSDHKNCTPDPEPQRSIEKLREQGALGDLTHEQIASAWEGIPETYWPSPAKPWRVAWGFGAFEDFRSKEQAEERRTELLATLQGDWRDSVHVSNVHDRTREMLADAGVPA